MALRLGILVLFCVLLVGGERIAEKKCKEYRQGTIQRSVMIPLTVNPKPVVLERFNCSTSVNLIVGGEAAKPGEFPHHALLGYQKSYDSSETQFLCGGSLISERFVLTAAHCFKQGKPIFVRLGANNLADEYENYYDIDVESTIRYEGYKGNSSYHDIALVKLKEKVRFGKYIRPACLWTNPKINVSSVIATGFGATGEEISSRTLQKVSLDLLDKINCNAQFKNRKKLFSRGIIDEQLCIGTLTGGKDTCQGDSGGPVQTLLEEKGCTYHVIGVTSIGAGVCGIGKSSAIYTKVSAYIDWIERHVWQLEN